MTILKTAALGAMLASFAAGGAFAQTMSTGSMSTGDMSKMSSADMKKMKSCQGMSHDMMMKNKGCMKMMKMHPDMMKSDDSMMMKK